MDKAWKNLDLEGQGLQSANLRLVRLLKKRKVAYMWLLLFPTGMHRAYLADAHGAWIYRVISVLTAVSFILGYFIPGLVLLLPLIGFALYDIRWIEDQTARLNKKLRMQVMMKQGTAAPREFKGRYTDDGLEAYLKTKEQERGGHAPAQSPGKSSHASRAPSFSEQEAMLRELAKSRHKKD